MDWKKVGKYSLYVIPFYVAYKELKKPKGERSTLGTIGLSIYALGFAVKFFFLPAFIGKGVSTGNWNPFKQKEEVEKIENSPESSLEKKINYEEAIKSLDN